MVDSNDATSIITVMSRARMLTAAAAATETATCEICGRVFGAKRTPKGYYFITRFCSRKCGGIHRRVSQPFQPCAKCGKPFQRRSGEHRKYCSKPCSEWAQRYDRGWVRLRRGYPVFWTGKAEVLVHRIVMEERLGRPLRETETVHHANGDRTDWRIENLELWDHAQPHGQRVPDKLAWCVAYLTDHGYTVTGPDGSVFSAVASPTRTIPSSPTLTT